MCSSTSPTNSAIPSAWTRNCYASPTASERRCSSPSGSRISAPDIEVGICPDIDSGTPDSYPAMDVRIIQKQMPIPSSGFVVNVETLRQDQFSNDGVFTKSNLDYTFSDCQKYLDAPHAVMLFPCRLHPGNHQRQRQRATSGNGGLRQRAQRPRGALLL